MKLEGKRILLVEDEYFIVDDLARAFRAAGAVVLGPVATVSEALMLVVASGALDGAVLDINLQGEPVYPVADALVTRGVPFIFSTGYDRETIPSRFDGYMRCEKPVSPERVVKALFGLPA
jgi:CheY-like chemotaxis protein